MWGWIKNTWMSIQAFILGWHNLPPPPAPPPLLHCPSALHSTETLNNHMFVFLILAKGYLTVSQSSLWWARSFRGGKVTPSSTVVVFAIQCQGLEWISENTQFQISLPSVYMQRVVSNVNWWVLAVLIGRFNHLWPDIWTVPPWFLYMC